MSTAKPAPAKATFEEVVDAAAKVMEQQATHTTQPVQAPAAPVAAAPAKVPTAKSVWGTVKGFFTSPTMCTMGMLGASMVAGAVGGIAATEARSRGYLGGPSPVNTPMLLPPSNNGG